MEFFHKSVMLNECLDLLDIKPNGIYVDGTVGGAGHSVEIAKRLDKDGMLIAFDRDPDAIAAATQRLEGYNAKVVRSNFSQMKDVLNEMGIDKIDGVLLDLGVSSHQLDDGKRGFSYNIDAELDMRMSKEGLSAKDIVNTYSKDELAKILFEYGEEKFAWRIAENIIRSRENEEIETTFQLSEIVKESVPAKVRREKNPCKKTFQAIRIAVNGEFDHIAAGLDSAFELLKPGGRIAVITFHSLEDRLVKQRFAGWCKGCICNPDFPQCICGRTPQAKLVNRKPVEAGENELSENNRSRSAKLRVLERI